MKPLEKFLKKQGSHLAGRPGPGAGGGGGGGGQLSRRPSVSKILLPGFLKDEPPEAGPEGDGRWLELRPPEGALRSPTSFSSEELSPAGGGGGGGESQLSPEAVPTCCWAPLAEPESPERLLERLLERLAGEPTAPHGHGCGAEDAGEGLCREANACLLHAPLGTDVLSLKHGMATEQCTWLATHRWSQAGPTTHPVTAGATNGKQRRLPWATGPGRTPSFAPCSTNGELRWRRGGSGSLLGLCVQ
ncbi:UNVERIFIED_CONTAM: hypothetical protein K2H54_014672 [Gekko kuhli]